jgi:dTDP-4-dehydrorhamnose 3,5-epimerase and related enzymes
MTNGLPKKNSKECSEHILFKRLARVKHTREDGWLSELVSMNYKDEPFNCIHTYLVFVNPGKIRANHYHKNKEEWIAPASGKIEINLENVISGEKEKLIVDTAAKEYEMIYIPPFVAHAIKNNWEHEASLVVFSKNSEDKEDTIPYEVFR